MFFFLLVYLFPLLERMLDCAENSRREAYLVSAVDIVELERRMRSIEFDS
jgi:hypothetical protein